MICRNVSDRRRDFTRAAEYGAAPAADQSRAILRLNGEHRVIAIPPGNVATQVVLSTEQTELPERCRVAGAARGGPNREHVVLLDGNVMVDPHVVRIERAIAAEPRARVHQGALSECAATRRDIVVARVPRARRAESGRPDRGIAGHQRVEWTQAIRRSETGIHAVDAIAKTREERTDNAM